MTLLKLEHIEFRIKYSNYMKYVLQKCSCMKNVINYV